MFTVFSNKPKFLSFNFDGDAGNQFLTNLQQ